jgi:predicted Zn finger-like uncharacterized protein
MKIVCESCGAKYSIADERVSGKTFKIRCKRCSEVIVVRGDQQSAPVAAAAAPAAPAEQQDAIWHVVVEGEQAGPYTPAQLGEMLTNRTVDWEAYVWTEGFENWAPMRDVTDLVAQITGQPAQAAVPAEAAFRPPTQTLTGQPSMGADPFADESAANIPDPFASAPAIQSAPDLFSRGNPRAAASPFNGAGEEPGVLSSSPSPRMSAERVMTGARNENSVLFSLKNLQALATGSPSGPPAIAGAGAAAASSGFAGGEGSGLIDIRALATTTGVGDGGQLPGHRDELLSMGSQGGAFGTLGSPMMSPASDDSDGGRKTIVWAVVAGVGLVSVAFVAAAYILRPGMSTPTAAVGVGTQAPAVAVAPQPAVAGVAVAPGAAPGARVEPPSEGELAAKRTAEEQDKAREADKSGSSRGSSSGDHHHHHGSETSGTTKSSGAGEPAAPAAEEVKKPAPKGGPRSIDDLLDNALQAPSSAKGSHGPAEAAAASNLPPQPSREEVMSAMNGVKSGVQACAKGAGGVATVTVNVAGATGRVTTADVQGVTGPAGSCIAQAVRKAQFGKFSQRVFKITFPYKL